MSVRYTNSYYNRPFGWTSNGGDASSTIAGGLTVNNITSPTEVVQFDYTNIELDSPYKLYFDIGTTEVKNTSIITSDLKGSSIYYDNAYEYSNGSGMTHHQDVSFLQDATVQGDLYVNSIEPYSGGQVVVDGNLRITNNLEVLGTTTALATENLIVQDNYINLAFGYSSNVATDSGLIANRLPSATTYSLSGNFVAGDGSNDPEVHTVAADGLNFGDIIQIVNSTNNNGYYEVRSHVSNVLKIKGTAIPTTKKFVVSQFAAEAAAGFAQVVNITGLMFESNGAGLSYINGSSTGAITSQAVVLNGSSPSFLNTTSETLTLTDITNNNANARILCTDNDGVVSYRSSASLLPTSNNTTNMLCLATWSTDSTSVYVKFRLDHMNEIIGLQIEDFSLTLTTAADYITIDIDPEILPTRRVVFPITVYHASAHEECNAVVESLSLRIYRKDGSQFSIGTVSHCTQNIPGMTVPAQCTQFTYMMF